LAFFVLNGAPKPAIFARVAATTSVRKSSVFDPTMRTFFRVYCDALGSGAPGS